MEIAHPLRRMKKKHWSPKPLVDLSPGDYKEHKFTLENNVSVH